MSEVTADADLLAMRLRRGARCAGVGVTERDPFVGVLDDGLYALPARLGMAEKSPGRLQKLLGIAVTARQKIDEHFIREVLDRMLHGVRRHRIRQSRVPDQEIR